MAASNETFVRPTYADLFAGIGGFASIFEAFGLEHVYSVERDESASGVYLDNWGNSSLGDIVSHSKDGVFAQLADISILSGGFPCQPFSKSGAQLGKNDPNRGNLFDQIVELLETKKPRVLFLENVRNIAGPRHSDYWSEIIRRLRAAGYRVSSDPEVLTPNRLAPHLGGRPQHRERVYILGTYVGDLGANEAELIQTQPLAEVDPSLQGFDAGLWDEVIKTSIASGALAPSAPQHERTPLDSRDEAVINAWDRFLAMFRENNPGKRFPSFPIWSKTWVGALASHQPMPDWKIKLVALNEDFYQSNKTWIETWRQEVAFQPGSIFNDTTMKFEWQAGDNSSIWDGLIQFRPSGVRAKRIGRFPALVAITQLPVLGPLKAYLSVEDAKYLQGLPGNFSFTANSNEKSSFKQLGNGINSGLAWRALRGHLVRDEKWLKASEDGRALMRAFDLDISDVTPLIERRLRKP